MKITTDSVSTILLDVQNQSSISSVTHLNTLSGNLFLSSPTSTLTISSANLSTIFVDVNVGALPSQTTINGIQGQVDFDDTGTISFATVNSTLSASVNLNPLPNGDYQPQQYTVMYSSPNLYLSKANTIFFVANTGGTAIVNLSQEYNNVIWMVTSGFTNLITDALGPKDVAFFGQIRSYGTVDSVIYQDGSPVTPTVKAEHPMNNQNTGTVLFYWTGSSLLVYQ
jgi:hypothetical protein